MLVTVVVSVPYRENGYEDKIKLIRGKLEEVELPVDKVLHNLQHFQKYSFSMFHRLTSSSQSGW